MFEGYGIVQKNCVHFILQIDNCHFNHEIWILVEITLFLVTLIINILILITSILVLLVTI